MWITGNDDAAGIGALGVASCVIAESPEYNVYSLLFEDHSLDEAAREKIVHDLRSNTLLLEQHMKVSKNREVLCADSSMVAEMKNVVIPAAALADSGTVTAYFPPELGPSDVEIAVEALGTENNAAEKSALTVVGHVKSKGPAVSRDISRTLCVHFRI